MLGLHLRGAWPWPGWEGDITISGSLLEVWGAAMRRGLDEMFAPAVISCQNAATVGYRSSLLSDNARWSA